MAEDVFVEIEKVARSQRRRYEPPAVTGIATIANVVRKSGIGSDQAWPHPVRS